MGPSRRSCDDRSGVVCEKVHRVHVEEGGYPDELVHVDGCVARDAAGQGGLLETEVPSEVCAGLALVSELGSDPACDCLGDRPAVHFLAARLCNRRLHEAKSNRTAIGRQALRPVTTACLEAEYCITER